MYEEGGATRGFAVYLDGGQLYFNVWNRKIDDGDRQTRTSSIHPHNGSRLA